MTKTAENKALKKELFRKICFDDISHPILSDLDHAVSLIAPDLPQKDRYNLIFDILYLIFSSIDDTI